MPLHFENKPALVAYVTCGDPDLATTREIMLAAIEAGAGVIELGVPFSDPVADGPVIQRASERALKHGTSLPRIQASCGDSCSFTIDGADGVFLFKSDPAHGPGEVLQGCAGGRRGWRTGDRPACGRVWRVFRAER